VTRPTTLRFGRPTSLASHNRIVWNTARDTSLCSNSHGSKKMDGEGRSPERSYLCLGRDTSESLALIVLQTLFRFISSIKEPRSYRKVWPAWLIVLEEVRWTLEFPLLGRPQRPQGHARRPWTTKGMARNSAAILMPMTMLRAPRTAVQRGVRLGNFAPDGGNSIVFSTTIEIRLSSTGESFQGLS